MVTTIGVDPHKATHTGVAIDESERVLGEVTVRANRSELKTLLDWADRVGATAERASGNAETSRPPARYPAFCRGSRMVG